MKSPDPSQRPTDAPSAAALLRWLDRFEALVTIVAFSVLVLTMFADVLSREITGVGLHWARQVGVYANIVIVMLGLGIASAHGSHLRPRFADSWLPVRFDRVLNRIQDLLMGGFCAVIAGLALVTTIESASLREVSALLPIVIWPIMAVIPLAFALVALRHFVYALEPSLKPESQHATVDGDA